MFIPSVMMLNLFYFSLEYIWQVRCTLFIPKYPTWCPNNLPCHRTRSGLHDQLQHSWLLHEFLHPLKIAWTFTLPKTNSLKSWAKFSWCITGRNIVFPYLYWIFVTDQFTFLNTFCFAVSVHYQQHQCWMSRELKGIISYNFFTIRSNAPLYQAISTWHGNSQHPPSMASPPLWPLPKPDHWSDRNLKASQKNGF